MARTLTRSHKAFILAFVVVAVLAFVPARWLAWTNDIAGIVNIPLAPFGDLGTTIAGVLKPPGEVLIRNVDSEQQLLREFDELDRLYIAAQMRIRELEMQLEEIQQIPMAELTGPVRPLAARVTARDPRSQIANIRINRGSQHGVAPGTIVVHAGVHLIGKVSSVDRLSSTVTPITNPDHGPMRAVVVPGDQSRTELDQAVLISVTPRGDGTFIAEPHPDQPMSVGDIVRLAASPGWPRSSLGMVIGVIESISDEPSLRTRVVITPHYHAHQLANLVLKIELDDEGGRLR
jgi:cell shape-determining protein MreC